MDITQNTTVKELLELIAESDKNSIDIYGTNSVDVIINGEVTEIDVVITE